MISVDSEDRMEDASGAYWRSSSLGTEEDEENIDGDDGSDGDDSITADSLKRFTAK